MKIYEPRLENKDLLDKYLIHNTFPGCEFSAANNILWGSFYHACFTIIEDMLVFCKLEEGRPVMMSFPIGEHDPRVAFDRIIEYFTKEGLPVKLYLVEEKMFELIDSWYPGVYEISYDRDEADYLYLRETLVRLQGKKLHGKRNHINRFLENHPDYVYEKIDDENVADCLELSAVWDEENNAEHDEEKSYERKALEYALHYRKELGLIGALIRVDGKAVAFTLGERLTEDTFVVHFEKAYADVQGAYPMINKEFVKRELKGYKYVNREEDMGIPGLRHAKTSYQPIRLVEKGIVTLRQE